MKLFRMGNLISCLLCLCAASSVFAQDDSKNLFQNDIWTAPSSPALTMIGAAPREVERPGSVRDLAFYIMSQTENLTSLPGQGFALEAAPYFLATKGNFSWKDYESQAFRPTFLQTFTLSAVVDEDDSDPDHVLSRLGFGARFSLSRGKFTPTYVSQLEEIHQIQAGIATPSAQEIARRIDEDESIKELEAARDSFYVLIDNMGLDEAAKERQRGAIDEAIDESITAVTSGIVQSVMAGYETQFVQLKERAAALQPERVGLMVDCALGMSSMVWDRSVEKAQFDRWGLWITATHTDLAAFYGVPRAMVRFLSDEAGQTESLLEYGAGTSFSKSTRHELSAEYLQRRNIDRREWTWRAALNVDFRIASNKSITVTFGRDYEGNEDGTLIALANLVLGFGSLRPME